MKSRLKKFLTLALASAFAAGVFVTCGFGAKLPADTYIGGVDVSNMTHKAAIKAVREGIISDLKGRVLTVCAGDEYSFTYPEIGFKEDAARVVSTVTKSGSYPVNVQYYLNSLDGVVSGICAAQSQKLREPCAVFNPNEGQPFYYYKGVKGVYADKDRLKRDIISSLNGKNGDFKKVQLHTKELSPSKNMRDVLESTRLLSAYTTYFDGENLDRAHNICLAARRLSGAVIAPQGSFSFNGQVGARTKERGYKNAKIIVGGRYVYGVGGGVCQLSTTLYNAALLAGLKVTEYHPHSLKVSYVEPSRDAMVSGNYFDLKIKNTGDCPAYIRVLTGSYYVRCEVYGKSDGCSYNMQSELLPSDEKGLKSRCYLLKTRGGITEQTLLREDAYAYENK